MKEQYIDVNKVKVGTKVSKAHCNCEHCNRKLYGKITKCVTTGIPGTSFAGWSTGTLCMIEWEDGTKDDISIWSFWTEGIRIDDDQI